jgi:hypothetical protein
MTSRWVESQVKSHALSSRLVVHNNPVIGMSSSWCTTIQSALSKQTCTCKKSHPYCQVTSLRLNMNVASLLVVAKIGILHAKPPILRYAVNQPCPSCVKMLPYVLKLCYFRCLYICVMLCVQHVQLVSVSHSTTIRSKIPGQSHSYASSMSPECPLVARSQLQGCPSNHRCCMSRKRYCYGYSRS